MFLPKEVENKFNTLTVDPSTVPRICVHVANGGSMLDLCELWGVPYGVLLEWINEDDRRYKLYQKALEAQMYWAIDTVLKELKQMGTVDISRAYDDNGKLLNVKAMPADVRACIASIDVYEEFEGVGRDRELIGLTKKVKVFDKLKALELIGKKFAMWIDRTKVDLDSKSLEDLIADTWKEQAVEAETVATLPPSDAGTPHPGESRPLPRVEGPIPSDSQDSDAASSVSKEQPESYWGKD